MVEAVLLHVVAQPELERRVDLRLLARERLGERGSTGSERSAPEVNWPASAPHARGGAIRARRAGSSRSQTSSSGSNCAARASTSPSAATTTLPPSKTSSSWPPDGVAEREGSAVGASPLGDHRLAGPALAAVVGRGRGVDDQAARRPPPRRSPGTPGARCPRRRSGRSARRRPRSEPARCRARSSGARRRRRSWADRTCGRCPGPRRRRGPRASCRPGEGAGRSAGSKCSSSSGERSTRSGKPTRATMPSTSAAIASSPSPHGGEEVTAQEQVLGRIAGDAELGQHARAARRDRGRARSTPRSGARCPRRRRRWGRSGRARGASWSPRPYAQVWLHPPAGLPCRACSGRIESLPGAAAWT